MSDVAIRLDRWPQHTEAVTAVVKEWRQDGTVAIIDKADWLAIRAGEQPTAPTPQPKGPGDHYHDVIYEHTGKRPCGGCIDLMREMNQWGIEGCRERRDEIIEQSMENAKKLGLHYELALATPKGKNMARRRLGDWFDEAMERAENTTNTKGDDHG